MVVEQETGDLQLKNAKWKVQIAKVNGNARHRMSDTRFPMPVYCLLYADYYILLSFS